MFLFYYFVWKKILVARYYVLPYFAGKTLLPAYPRKGHGFITWKFKIVCWSSRCVLLFISGY